MNLVSIAARNVFRNTFRSSLTVVGTAVGVLAFLLLRTVVSAWYVGIDYAAKDRLATRNKVSFIVTLPKRYIDTVRGVQGVTDATWANWFGGRDPRDTSNFFASFAVDSKTYFQVYNEMVVPPEEMSAWQQDRRGAILGDILAKKLGVKVGDTVTLTGTIFPGDWQFFVNGIYKASAKSVDRSQFVFHWDYLNESVAERRRDQLGWIVTRIDKPERSAEISGIIDKIFDDKDIQTATMSERAMNMSFMATVSAILSALQIVSGIILVIMTMIMGNTIAMGVRERTNEYGVMRAIGFSSKHIGWMVVGEAITMGLVAGLLGVALSFPIIEHGLGRWLEENMGSMFPYFRLDRFAMLLGVTVSMLLAAVAAILPAYRAMKLPVTQALRRVA